MNKTDVFLPISGPQLLKAKALRCRIAELEISRPKADSRSISSGCADLDRLLSGGGFHSGTLVEWFSTGEGAGAETLAVRTAREACRQGGALVVLDRRRDFYPPAVARLGLDLNRIVLVRPRGEADYGWALDQALRCGAVDAVWAWTERIEPRTFRRLQLAAEQGGTLGMLMRSHHARHEPSWAEVRLLVEPLPGTTSPSQRTLRIHLLRCRGSIVGEALEVEIDDEADTVRSIARLEPGRRQERA